MRRAMLFGKLPTHGDFVARGVDAAERDAIDQWLSGSLAEARTALGDAFDSIYDQAPPWRFTVEGPGGWHAGALAPSMDGVGRRFPIMAGIGGLDAGDAEAAAEAAEEAIYAALGEGWDADRLVATVEAAEPAAVAAPATTDRWWTLGGGSGAGSAFLVASLPGRRPARLMQTMLTLSPLGQEEVA